MTADRAGLRDATSLRAHDLIRDVLRITASRGDDEEARYVADRVIERLADDGLVLDRHPRRVSDGRLLAAVLFVSFMLMLSASVFALILFSWMTS